MQLVTYLLSLQSVVIQPLTSTWPHLRCDVCLEEGEYWKNTVSVLQYCVLLRTKQFLQVVGYAHLQQNKIE